MLLHLDFSSGVPIYQQIRNQIVLGIASGSLPPGQWRYLTEAEVSALKGSERE